MLSTDGGFTIDIGPPPTPSPAAHARPCVVLPQQKDKEKFEKLLALPSPEQSLSDKYSRFDPASGEPTHDKDGVELEGKGRDKARKDLEKARKITEPLVKKLAEDPDFMGKLTADIEQLGKQIEQISV